MQLKQIISDCHIKNSYHFTNDVKVNHLAFDSRAVKAGDMFIAIRGTQTDGHQYIEQAIQKQANVIVGEQFNPETIENNQGVIFLEVENSQKFLGIAAHTFFGKPSEKLKLVGVTGTNGKTTIATLLHELFTQLGYCAGLLSTIENKIKQKVVPSTHTTPDAISLNKMLQEMVSQGVSHCFMEVSSHAIDQNRIAGLGFAGGIFTNITQDHLDYHKDFKSYIHAKKKFFDGLSNQSFALSNADDRNGKVMLQNTRAKKIYYALRTPSEIKGKILENSLEGLYMTIDKNEIWFQLPGVFNAYNLLAIYGAATLLGEDQKDVLTKMSQLHSAEGRFDVVKSAEGKIAVIDYAHTPDALENILETLNQCRKPNQKIITVVGAGGNRDTTKRPIMGKVVASQSDQVIFTSDNPRNENPDDIIEDIVKGVEHKDKDKTISISNRKEAIKTACLLAKGEDIILIAGKGHEKYQEINGVKTYFNDKEIVLNIFNKA